MKILVLATNYPRPDGFVSLQYIHTRNKRYLDYDIDVSVISFASRNNYTLDGVKVYSLEAYCNDLESEKFDILISHAPNIREHYKFIKKYGEKFDNIVFFFHGHEVLRASKIYPKPYSYVKRSSVISRLIREFYDTYKLFFWKRFFVRNAYKSHFIFVSNWMYEMFLKFVKINPNKIINRMDIIYNSIGKEFENEKYDFNSEKKYDFITIRTSIDGSKYGIDIVNKLAKNNTQYSFCIIGKGEYFNHFEKADNVTWINSHLSHDEIIKNLNESKCALLPTRADAQGVMACEMATFGIPLITSNIEVCKEVFSEFNNVRYIDNEETNTNLSPIFCDLLKNVSTQKSEKYFAKNTIGKEVEVFNRIVRKGTNHG